MIKRNIVMKQIKFKIFLQKYKKIIEIIIVLIIVCYIGYAVYRIDDNIITQNPTMFGVMGTLIGSIIGGTFSLLGSVWVNSKQQRALQNIKRKKVIYSPLYDELVYILENVLTQNPYPLYININESPQNKLSSSRVPAWRRIKSDTRFLEVPDILVRQMDKLEKSIDSYFSVRGEADTVIKDVLNTVLSENDMAICDITNIGTIISHDILNNKISDIYGESMEIGGDKKLEESIRICINEQIYDKCNQNQTVLKVRKCYENWLKIQKETIEMLSLLIKQVLMKYEG